MEESQPETPMEVADTITPQVTPLEENVVPENDGPSVMEASPDRTQSIEDCTTHVIPETNTIVQEITTESVVNSEVIPEGSLMQEEHNVVDQDVTQPEGITQSAPEIPQQGNDAVITPPTITTVEDIGTATFRKVGSLYQCKICGQHLRTHFHLNSHMRTHSMEYRCTICSDSCQTKAQLIVHMKGHKTNEPVEYRCKICVQLFQNRYQLNSHMRHHKVKTPAAALDSTSPSTLTPPPEGPLLQTEPQDITELTRRNQNRKRDYRSLHHGPAFKISTARRLNGSGSRSVSTDNNDSQTPQVEMNGEKISPIPEYKCKICGKVCNDRFGLSGHMNSHRFSKDPTEGVAIVADEEDEDGNITFRKVPLTPEQKQHLKFSAPILVHDGPLHFRQLSKPHINKFVKVKPFKCVKCPYSAVASFSLALHIRLVHEGVVPHKCDFCWKSFPSQGRLEAHIHANHLNENFSGEENVQPTNESVHDLTTDEPEAAAENGIAVEVHPETEDVTS